MKIFNKMILKPLSWENISSIKFYFIVYIFLLFLFPKLSFAGECEIEDSTAPVLLEYLSNVDTVTQNILNWAKGGEKNNSAVNRIDYIITSLGEAINFWDLYSNFDFNIALSITHFIPSEVNRDHDKLLDKTEKLIDTLTNLVKSGYWMSQVSDPCAGVSNCNLEWWHARRLLADLIKNNKEIVKYYRYQILDTEYLLKENITLVPDNFETEMEKYYNEHTLSDCDKTFDDVLWKIQDIWTMFDKSSEWFRAWKEWFDLLKWINNKNKDTEKEILSKYLRNIWFDKKKSDIILDNLEKYNLWWLSAWHPISNSISYTFNRIDETADTFEWAIDELFKENPEKIPPKKISALMPEIQATVNIKNEIRNIFQPEVYMALPQDNTTEQLQQELINLHYLLIEANKKLAETIPKAEKICNQQGSCGKCSYR